MYNRSNKKSIVQLCKVSVLKANTLNSVQRLFITLFQNRYCSADKCTNGPLQERSRVPGTTVPGNESSMERTVQGTNVLGTNGPENESSIMGTNVPGNEQSWERIFLIPTPVYLCGDDQQFNYAAFFCKTVFAFHIRFCSRNRKQ